MASAASPCSPSDAPGPAGGAGASKRVGCCWRILVKIAARSAERVVGVTTAVSSFGVSPDCHAFGSPVRSRTILTVASSSSYVDIS